MHNMPHSEESRALISKKKRGVPLLAKRRAPKVINGVELWKCPTCSDWISADGYYPKKRNWNGISHQCRKCHSKGSVKTRDKMNTRILRRESARRQRRENGDQVRERERLESQARRKDSEKIMARRLLNEAVRRGEVKKPDLCSRCRQDVKLSGHHADYSKPLEVEWLCYLCHAEIHYPLPVLKRVSP